jgi:hypothetical protein
MHTEKEKKRDKPTRKRDLSVVDILIVLLVLAAVAGIVYRVVDAARQSAAQGERPMYAVYFSVEETHKDVLAEIQGFDAVYDPEDGVKLGYIAAYEDTEEGGYKPALAIVPAVNATGRDRVTASGCFICTEGTMMNGGLLVDGDDRYLTPGTELSIRTDRVILTIRITEIRLHD